jgi:hypothetical protein
MVVVARRWIAKRVRGRWTALHAAASGGAEQAYHFTWRHTSIELVKVLIAAGANVGGQNNDG